MEFEIGIGIMLFVGSLYALKKANDRTIEIKCHDLDRQLLERIEDPEYKEDLARILARDIQIKRMRELEQSRMRAELAKNHFEMMEYEKMAHSSYKRGLKD